MTATEHVVLVDLNDNAVGVMEKLAAHQQGLLHRAFSIFVYRHNVTTEILLQQRADKKYHSPGLWTNTCCSHPKPNEDIIQAGQRRLEYEMGISIPLRWLGSFHYTAHFANGLTENELDHVLTGELLNEESFQVNPEEVKDYRWISIANLYKEIAEDPSQFTPWFIEAFELAERKL